jgi:hypothetical protein
MRNWLFVISICCSHFILAQSPVFISSGNDKIQYEGRIGRTADSAAVLSWPGSSILIRFEGTEVKALLKDDRGKNVYNVIIDHKLISKLELDTAKKYYSLASSLSKGIHTLELFKRTEAVWGNTNFYGFTITGNEKLFQAVEKKLKMEFYGNSITCGYGIEDTTGGDSGASKYENNYLSYASVTARHFNAANHVIAVSGIGLMVSWFNFTMPDVYDKLNANTRDTYWDFKSYTPDIVVINLFQNDSWLVKMPDNAEFKRVFGTKAPDSIFIVNAYKNFVYGIRKTYPDAKIICALGAMDITRKGSPWPGYVKQAVALLNDKKMFTYFFPVCSSHGHPRVKHQQEMADQLINFIETNNLTSK